MATTDRVVELRFTSGTQLHMVLSRDDLMSLQLAYFGGKEIGEVTSTTGVQYLVRCESVEGIAIYP